jgi:hypothetical protein
VRANSEARESHFMFWECGSVRECEEWTSTLPSELPLWELEFWWTPKFSKSNYKGQNPLDWKVLYIIGNFLERRCPKWACITIWVIKTQVMAKRRVESQIWLPMIKSRELPWLPCVQVACHIPLKSSQWGLQLCFRPHLNRRSTHKIMGLQSYEKPNFGNFSVATPLWPSVGVKPNTWKSWGFGVLRDSRMFRARQQGANTPRIGVFLVSLESSWNVDIENGLALAIWTSSAQVMGKRRAGSQTGSLTPDH